MSVRRASQSHEDPVKNLLRPLRIGRYTANNRVVMSPVTRCRADDEHNPTPMMVKFYEQRASMGLLITECTMVQRNYSGQGYEPGIYSKEQIDGWRKVTNAVHAKGGLIFCQIYHPGRATVAANLTSDNLVVMGPTRVGIPPPEKCIAAQSRDGQTQPYPQTVHKMQEKEIADVVEHFVRAAKNAITADFDGVEIYAGAGYLIDQFLRDGCNDRTDAYGGSIEGRAKLLLEVVDGVIEAIGADRVGVRITPQNTFNGMSESNVEMMTKYVARSLDMRRVAFIDVVRGDHHVGDHSSGIEPEIRAVYGGALICSNGFTLDEAEREIGNKHIDAVAFGTLAIANPDLVYRVMCEEKLNKVDPSTFVTRGEKGYLDYPVLEPQHPAPKTGSMGRSSVSRPNPGEEPISRSRQGGSTTALPTSAPAPAKALLLPLLVGAVTLKNRMVMGPLPRQRCNTEMEPTDAVVKFYADRASFGLIVSEPCEVQPGYNTYARGAAISTPEQVAAWRRVTDAVHAKGGLMYCQLHHGGRAVLPCNLTDAEMRVMGPTEKGIPAQYRCPAAFAADGKDQPYSQKVVAVHSAKLQWLVEAYATAAKNAIAAGFDGVEIHAGGGYLIDQFLRSASNHRTDAYGGSVEGRMKLLLEVVDAVMQAVPAKRIGVRITPTDLSKGMSDSDAMEVSSAVAGEMKSRRIAYVALASGSDAYYHGPIPSRVIEAVKNRYPGIVLCDDNIDFMQAETRVAADIVHAACMTLGAVCNPDVVDRAVRGVRMVEPNMHALFTHDEEGYNTYPTFAEEKKKAWKEGQRAREASLSQEAAERNSAVASRGTTPSKGAAAASRASRESSRANNTNVNSPGAKAPRQAVNKDGVIMIKRTPSSQAKVN